jgi:prepilin peptidase CpaA
VATVRPRRRLLTAVMTGDRAFALAVAMVAAGWDLQTRRIPNALTFGAAVASLAYHLLTGGLAGLAHSAGGWAVGAAVFMLPFALRGMGGGDVKLMAALGAWVGPLDALWLALYAGIAGGILGVVVALGAGYFRRMSQNIWMLLCHWRVAGLTALPQLTLENSAAPKLAYAVPILAGVVAVIWLR